MSEFDFNQSEGLLLVGLPETNIPLLQMLQEKTGQDMSDIIAKALTFLAHHLLTEDERKDLVRRMNRKK